MAVGVGQLLGEVVIKLLGLTSRRATGDKLQKRLSEQRRYLRDTYNGLTEIAGKRDFLQSLANLANFTRTAWGVGTEETPVFGPFEIKDDDVLVCFDALRDLKHNITIAPLARFHAAWRTLGEERAKKVEDLKQAIRATAVFSMLWRERNLLRRASRWPCHAVLRDRILSCHRGMDVTLTCRNGLPRCSATSRLWDSRNMHVERV